MSPHLVTFTSRDPRTCPFIQAESGWMDQNWWSLLPSRLCRRFHLWPLQPSKGGFDFSLTRRRHTYVCWKAGAKLRTRRRHAAHDSLRIQFICGLILFIFFFLRKRPLPCWLSACKYCSCVTGLSKSIAAFPIRWGQKLSSVAGTLKSDFQCSMEKKKSRICWWTLWKC